MKSAFTAIVSLIGVVLCVLSGTVLLSYHRKKHSPQRLLAFYFYVVGYLLLIILLIVTGLIEKIPHLFRSGILAAYIFPPLAYLYVRQNIQPGIGLKDLSHFLPALLYFIDFLPFYFLSAEEKVTVIRSVTGTNVESLLAHREGWMTPPWFHLVFRNVIALFYWILSFRLLWRLTYVRGSTFYQENASVVKWLWTFVVFQLLIFVPYIMIVLVGQPQYTFYTSTIPFTMMVTFTSIALFFRPSIFYGFSGVLFQSESRRENNIKDDLHRNEKSSHKLELEYLRNEDIIQLKGAVSKFLSVSQPYLVPGYTIHDFSKDVDIPVRKLSAYLNKSENLNFRDFLNRHRVDYCVKNLSDGAWQNLTLEAIAQHCGFNNRNSFTAAFKKFTGANPSAFLLQLKQTG